VDKWRKMAHRNRLTILGTALGLLLAMVVLWVSVVPRSDPLTGVLRKRGYPTSLAELDAWYPAVPAAQNAALIYSKAFARLVNSAGTISNFLARNWLPPIGQGFTPQENADLAGIIEANSEALRLLHSVPAYARSRYPIDLRKGYTIALPYLAQTRQAVLLLATEALVQAGNGETEAATRSFLAAGRVVESVAEEPLLISQKVRSMNWNTLLARLERALSVTTFSDGQLADLQEQVQTAERPQAALRGWVTEWVAGKTLFHDRRIMDSALVGHSLIGPPKPGQFHVVNLAPWVRAGCLSLLRVAGQQEKDEAFYLDYVGRRVSAMELPYPARFAAMQRLAAITNAPGRFCIFSQMLVAVRPWLDCQDAEHTARIHVAATVLAIERFRLAHGGTLPVSLDQLAPAWLDKVPSDPFDGQALHYQTHGSSYAVYSVGSDCQDGGGVDWDKGCLKTPSDIALVVKH
jgi:hypothetical protein